MGNKILLDQRQIVGIAFQPHTYGIAQVHPVPLHKITKMFARLFVAWIDLSEKCLFGVLK